MNNKSYTENYLTECLYNLTQKNILSATSYLMCIADLYDELSMKGIDSPMFAIAKDMQQSRMGNTIIDKNIEEEDKIVDLLLLLLYYPLKHYLTTNRICYKQVRPKEYHIYIYNGKYWDVEKDPVAYARKLLRTVGYNYDLALEEHVTASIYKAIKKIEFKLQACNHNMLNFNNMVIQFTNDGVTQKKHSADFYCTDIIRQDYIEDLKCPNFNRFMNNILSEQDQQIFINFIASSFSPTRLHQKMLNIYGKAGAGKSTLVDIIGMVLGSNVIAMGLSDLINKGSGFSQSDTLAMLRGKTLLHAREVNDFGNKSFDSEKFKMMIEGSQIHLATSVNAEYREPIICPLIIATSNDAMDLGRVDKGVARRITFIEILEFIPEKSIANLAQMIYEKETIGIINLIIKAYKKIMTNKYDKTLFDNNLSDYYREFNKLNDNPVQEAIIYALNHNIIQVIDPITPKNQWNKCNEFIRDLTLMLYPDAKWKVNSGKQISRLIMNSNIPKTINKVGTSLRHRVINLEYTEQGREIINKLRLENMQDKLADMELRNAIK